STCYIKEQAPAWNTRNKRSHKKEIPKGKSQTIPAMLLNSALKGIIERLERLEDSKEIESPLQSY
ncbi:968_t:CDS:2, partial [Gigaspora rosea]